MSREQQVLLEAMQAAYSQSERQDASVDAVMTLIIEKLEWMANPDEAVDATALNMQKK
ncbi:hypothetical protein [Domibacillus robiginosus]|uniref:hypothetical protein n=1 Tax=Domibacillus robiginosus TaxID=1071054 RepID=UPI000AA1B67C|nr:hypothetical protein [Domibacillus robiginosus]